MALTSDQISQQIRTQLKLLDPDFSADPLTPERKIIDTVAEVMADANTDQFTLNYQFNIDSKVGTDLDNFVALFGFGRIIGKQASGTVTFSVAAPQISDIVIPAGSVVTAPASANGSQVNFYTTTTVTLFAGTTSVDAPIVASVTGTIGNVVAGSISALGSSYASKISAVTNATATSGGTDAETDAELRIRFKNTIFRNIAGTESQYLALALSSIYTTKAKVISPIDRFIEYVQIPSNLIVTSQIPYSKYTYNFDYYVTQNDSTTGTEIFFDPGVDFSFSGTVPPTFTILTQDTTKDFAVGSVVLFEHSYCSKNSRNDPSNNIMNYVDIYISGTNGQDVTESVVFPSSANNFTNTSSSAYYIGNYKRTATDISPTVGNRFQPLLWQPVIDLANSITVNGITFTENTDYWLVEDTTVYKGSKRARNGIEWSSQSALTITSGTGFSVDYTFNKLPITINELVDGHKQIVSDTLIHAATNRYFNLNFIVMYNSGFGKSSVDSALSTALTGFMNKQDFGAVIQISDLLEIAHEVPGVDNIRLAMPSDNVAYGIQEVASDGTTPIGSPYIVDFSLSDSDLPVVNSVVTTRKSQNTWS